MDPDNLNKSQRKELLDYIKANGLVDMPFLSEPADWADGSNPLSLYREEPCKSTFTWLFLLSKNKEYNH